MSSLLRASRTLGTLRSLRTPPQNKPISSHFFSPSHTPRHTNLARPRHYSQYRYGPPSNERTNMMILYGLIGANVTIFSYAMYLKTQAVQGFQQPFVKFMKTMTLNLDEFRAGAYLPILTNVFTHLDIMHLGSNMLAIYFMGGFLATAPMITPLRYLTIALGSGITGSLGFLYNREQRSQGGRDYVRGLGFSGAVMGVSSVAACLAPTQTVLIWGILPMPLWGLVTLYAAYDGYYLNSQESKIGHAGHLGGLAFGIVYYFARLRGWRG